LTPIDAGEPTAAAQLLPLDYGELRRLAAAQMAGEKPGLRMPRRWCCSSTCFAFYSFPLDKMMSVGRLMADI
jgi:hypothetical protein